MAGKVDLPLSRGTVQQEDRLLARDSREAVAERPLQVRNEAFAARGKHSLRRVRGKVCYLAGGTASNRWHVRRRVVVVVNQLRDEVLAPMFTPNARTQIDRAVQKVEKVRVLVQIRSARTKIWSCASSAYS